MKSRFLYIIKYFFFWILVFIIQKILFMLFNYQEAFNLGFKDWIMVIYKGLPLDFSAAAYICAIPALIVIAGAITTGDFIRRFINIYSYIVLFLVLYLGVVDMDLYSYWGYKLDISPLIYMRTPSEALASVKFTEILMMLIVLAVLYFLFLKIYQRYFNARMILFPVPWWKDVVSGLIILIVLIIPARGGTGIVPMNLSRVYFHHKPFANHSAINVLWNTIYSLTERKKLETRIQFMDEKKADQLFGEIMQQERNNTERIIINDPNIILIILESFSNKIIGELGGEKGITPGLDSLYQNSVFFRNFFANGDRSDKGMIALFSGFPAQPTTSIINYPKKSQNLPFLYDPFAKRGYNTAFYYGGNLNFSNFKSYFSRESLHNLITIEDFQDDIPRQEWGIPDEYMYERLYNDLLKQQDPFFFSFFTLSSHEPYDVPMEPVFGKATRDELSKNSFYYADYVLHEFLIRAKTTDWWDNTLIIITADHGSRNPGNTPNHVEEKFNIPMIWTGGAVLKDTIISKCGSQADLPATLLSQLSINADEFKYSKNLLNPYSSSFAFYAYNNGFGVKTDDAFVIYDNDFQKILEKKGDMTEESLKAGMAFLQEVSEDFSTK